ncbi:MAG TPA: FAD:protein FMN transferase [Longimicrobiales bacterium]|nr:FAD:protein FMN transferase [Longimicrobiales bacterium]
MRAFLCTLLALGAIAPAAVAQAPRPADLSDTPAVEREAFVMGTRLGVRVSGPAAAAAAEAALRAARGADDLLSTWRADAELAAVNAAPAGEARRLSPELVGVLSEVAPWVARTGGAFDPAVGALVDAWGTRGEARVPTAAELAAALAATGWSRVRLDASAGTLVRGPAALWLDAGGFGKGLALRRAAAELESRGARGLVNFGGQVAVIGGPERIGVAHAAERERPIAELVVADASVSTTSSSERGGHVLDPRTGRPVPGWGSVTVVAEDALVADILSTALFVMGADAALAWAAHEPYGVLVQELTSEGVRVRSNAALARWVPDEEGSVAPPSPGPSRMSEGTPAQDTTELARLKRQVEAITRELERMRLGGDVVARADSGVYGFGPAASKVYRVAEGVSIGGYGEVLYAMPADELEDGTESAAANRWDALRAILYIGYRFSDRLLFNSEIEIEHGNEAYLEFAYLDYMLTETVGLRGGLLLAPLGLVNELHEPPVFLGSTRPLVEQALIPTTWRENGFGAFGAAGPVAWRAYVMNGLNGAGFSAAGFRGGRQKGINALAEDVGLALRADYEGVLGLLAGGSVYYGGADQGLLVGGEEIDVTQLIWEAHAAWQARGLDLRALVAGGSLDGAAELNAALGLAGAASVGETLWGGYAHAGYDVLRAVGTTHQLFPYVRYEWLNTQAEVPEGYAANPALDRTAILLGASWKPVPQVAVKGDYQIHRNEAETGRNGFSLVLSYLF